LSERSGKKTLKKLHPAAELAAYKTGALKPPSGQDDEDRYLRLAAEFDNFKKRTARQFTEIIQGANEELILEILDVLDDFHRALDSVETDRNKRGSGEAGNILRGMELIHDKFMSVLKARGVEPMEALKKPFDPVYHEAVMQSPSDEQEGTVIGIISPGYLMNGKVIRHAKVVVAASKPN
jgi:molecular chaperone GrpE